MTAAEFGFPNVQKQVSQGLKSDGTSLNKAPTKLRLVSHQPSYLMEKVPNTGIITLMK